MRLFVHHDDSGRIRSATVFDAPPNAGMALATVPGERVSEIESHKLKRCRGTELAVRKLIRTSVVAAPAARAALAPRRKTKKR